MIRLLVVDDQELVRQGIVALLGFEQDLQVIGQALMVKIVWPNYRY